MGRIRSALEIALERTESIKTDKSSVGMFEARQEGKKIANLFIADPSKSLEDALKSQPKESQAGFKQGIFDVLSAQISLPVSESDLVRIDAVGKGLAFLIKDGRFTALYKQLSQLMVQYIDDTAHTEKAIRAQYAPKLQQKEDELSKRLGQEVHIDPFQDPEFVMIFNQNINALKTNYQAPLDQVKAEATRLWNEQARN